MLHSVCFIIIGGEIKFGCGKVNIFAENRKKYTYISRVTPKVVTRRILVNASETHKCVHTLTIKIRFRFKKFLYTGRPLLNCREINDTQGRLSCPHFEPNICIQLASFIKSLANEKSATQGRLSVHWLNWPMRKRCVTMC